MTLKEISKGYEETAVILRKRLRELHKQLKTAEDPEDVWHIKRQITELTPILTQMNDLRELTEHYYEKGYWRDKKYSL